MTSTATVILDGLGIVGFIGGGLVTLFSRTSKENTSAATELIANLQKLRETDKEEFNMRIKALEDQHIEDEKRHLENVKAISDLQGQVKVYKELPLKELAEGIRKVATSNAEILKELRKTSAIAAEDRDVLTNSNKHIRNEVDRRMEERG
jgi:hypothetical protein